MPTLSHAELETIADRIADRVADRILAALSVRSAEPVRESTKNPDSELICSLLREIAQGYGVQFAFTTSDLFDYAEHDETLHSALTQAFGRLDAQSGRKAGLLFHRIQGRRYGDFSIERGEDRRDGALWYVTLASRGLAVVSGS